MDQTPQEMEATLPGGAKFKVRGTDIVPAASFLVTAVLCYAFYVHAGDTREANVLIAAAIKELAAAQRDGNQTQRETNCIVAYKQNTSAGGGSDVMDFCKRVTR